MCLKIRVHCIYNFQPKIIRKHVVDLSSKFQAILWEYFPTQIPIANPRMSQNFGISSCSIGFYTYWTAYVKKFKEQTCAECWSLKSRFFLKRLNISNQCCDIFLSIKATKSRNFYGFEAVSYKNLITFVYFKSAVSVESL